MGADPRTRIFERSPPALDAGLGDGRLSGSGGHSSIVVGTLKWAANVRMWSVINRRSPLRIIEEPEDAGPVSMGLCRTDALLWFRCANVVDEFIDWWMVNLRNVFCYAESHITSAIGLLVAFGPHRAFGVFLVEKRSNPTHRGIVRRSALGRAVPWAFVGVMDARAGVRGCGPDRH
jgi:hypothetical protein